MWLIMGHEYDEKVLSILHGVLVGVCWFTLA
jgi:hypothetical protein